MNFLGINKPLSPTTRELATELFLEGETIRAIALRVKRGLGSIQRLRVELVDQGLLKGRARAKGGAQYRGPRRPKRTKALPEVRTGSEFIAPIPLSRLMAGK